MLKRHKINLRAVSVEDAMVFILWMNDPEVTKFLVRSKPITLTMEKEWIESVGKSDSEIVFTIEAIDGRKPVVIGSIGLHKIDWLNRSATFGIVIGDKKYWSNGYGTEAAELLIKYGFNSLNLHRIESAAYAFNKRSVALHKKLGFMEEGISRKAIYKNGKYHDVANFGFLRKEYKKLNK
ncbi:MAG: GNAT family N-acetyltransferase [Candidatus Moraniibacteriota bacterium]|jgi:diamine N-acetyltransferase